MLLFKKFITAFKKTLDFQSGDELNSDMSSSLKGNPAIYSGKDVIKIFLPAILIFFLVKNIVTGWKEIEPYLQLVQIVPLAFSFIILLLVYPESALSWGILAKKLKIRITLKNAFFVWILSNTARYIPGSIWQYLGRISMGESVGVKKREGLILVFAEVFFVVVAGVIVSLFSLNQWRNIGNNNSFLLLIIIPALVALHPKVSYKILQIIFKLMKKNEFVNPPKLSLKDSISVLPMFVINFFLNGIGLFLLLNALGSNLTYDKVFLVSGFYSLSWLAGYISIIAPGGLGVAEVTLAYFLSFLIPLPMASSVALLYRFLLIVAELIVFIVALRIRKFDLNSKSSH